MKITNLRQTGSIMIVGAVITTLTISVVLALADAPIVGQNNRVTMTYTNSMMTFTSIPGLSFTLLPNTFYQFTVSIIYKGTVAQFAVAPLPAGTTFTICGVEYNYATATAVRAGCTSATGTSISQYQNTPPNTDEPTFYTGVVMTGAIGGTFQMQGAVSMTGNTVTVEVNSWLEAQVSSV